MFRLRDFSLSHPKREARFIFQAFSTTRERLTISVTKRASTQRQRRLSDAVFLARSYHFVIAMCRTK
jgi:hypothetical protein